MRKLGNVWCRSDLRKASHQRVSGLRGSCCLAQDTEARVVSELLPGISVPLAAAEPPSSANCSAAGGTHTPAWTHVYSEQTFFLNMHHTHKHTTTNFLLHSSYLSRITHIRTSPSTQILIKPLLLCTLNLNNEQSAPSKCPHKHFPQDQLQTSVF